MELIPILPKKPDLKKRNQWGNSLQNSGCYIQSVDLFTLWAVEEPLEKIWLSSSDHLYIFVNLVMTHNYLGSLRGEKYLLLTIVWSNCWEKDRVLLTVHSHTDHYVVAFFLIYWWPASGRVHYCSSARDLISSSLPISGCIPYQSFNLQNLYQRKGNSWISRESKYSVGEFFTEVYST